MHYSKCLCWFKCLEWETATAKYVRVNKLIILAREILIKIAPLFHGSYTKCIYTTFQQTLLLYIHFIYKKNQKNYICQLNFVYKIYAKVCRNVVYYCEMGWLGPIFGIFHDLLPYCSHSTTWHSEFIALCPHCLD